VRLISVPAGLLLGDVTDETLENSGTKTKSITSCDNAFVTKNVAKKVEQVPAWFATRHEPVGELTEEKKACFAEERLIPNL
jgi:hypothetical protein